MDTHTWAHWHERADDEARACVPVAEECVQRRRAGLLHTGDDTNRVAGSQEGGQRREENINSAGKPEEPP